MKAIARFVGAMCFLFALFGSVHAQNDAHPGDDFLKLVDARKYAESWDISSDLLKQSVSRAEWTTQMAQARDALGDLASRRFKSDDPQNNPRGAPPGEYELLTYETAFGLQAGPRTETLALVKAGDGRWRVVGYFIR